MYEPECPTPSKLRSLYGKIIEVVTPLGLHTGQLISAGGPNATLWLVGVNDTDEFVPMGSIVGFRSI